MRRARVALARGRRCPCTARPPARRRRRRRRRNFARRVVYTMLCIALGVHAACLLHFLRARLRGPPPPSAPFARGPPRTHCTHRQLGGARHGPRVHIMVYTQIPTFPAVQPARARARQVPAAGARRAPLPPAAPPAAPPPLTATAPPPRRSPPPPRCSSPRLLAGGRRNTASAAVREQNRHGTIYLSTQHAFIDRAHRP